MEPSNVNRSWHANLSPINLLTNINKKIGNVKNAVVNFTTTSKETTKAQIVETEKLKPLPFDLGLEISNFHESVSQALTKGNDEEVTNSLSKLGTSVYKNCINRKENGKEKMLACESYVNAVLDVLENNPKVADLCREHLLASSDDNIVFALMNNPRFNITSLDEKQADIFLRAALRLVFNYVSVPPMMHNNICDLAKLSKMDKNTLEGFIEKSITVKNLDLADFLIKLNGDNLPSRESAINRAIEEQDFDLVEFIVKHEGSKATEELIKRSVDGNLESFLENVLTITDQQLTKSQVTEFSKQAHLQGNLSLMKSINPEWKELTVSEFKNIPEEGKANKLTQYFLNSNKQDVNELSLILKNNGLISDKLFSEANEFNENAGKLISRFPNPLHQQEVYQGYGKNFQNYGEQQQEYGKKHLNLVNNVIKEIQNNPSKSLESVYLSLINSKDENPWRMGVGETPLLTRYAMFKKLATEKLDRNYENPNISKPNLDGFDISFRSDGNPPFKLTTIAASFSNYEPALYFYHSRPLFDTTVPRSKRVPQWLDKLGISEDWKSLSSAKVNAKDPESVKQFEGKVAEFYWKGVQLMPTVRGNSRTMLELHYMLYKVNGLEPPTLSRYTVLPDCIALCSTLDEFKERYNSCWDK